MPLIINETRVVNPKAERCICGGEPKHSASTHSGSYSSGSAQIKCSRCGLEMSIVSHNIGYGDSVERLYIVLIAKWNDVMKKKNNAAL